MESDIKLDQEKSKIDELMDPIPHLNAISAYIEEHPEQFQSLNDFDYYVSEDGQVDITIHTSNGDEKLSDHLPEEVIIENSPGVATPYALKHWDLEGKLVSARIVADLAWVKENKARGVSALSHEIGHLLAAQHDGFVDTSKIDETPTTQQVFEESLETVCKVINNGLSEEVQAWNYGKIAANLFGIDELTYDHQTDTAMRAYTEATFFQLKGIVNDMTNSLKTANPEGFKIERSFSLYDVSQQQPVDLKFEEFVEKLELYSQDRTDRAANAMSS